MAEGLKVRLNVAETGGMRQYLHLFIGQVRGRMGYECMSDNRLRDVVEESVGSIPRQFGCRVGGVQGLHNRFQ